MMPKFIGISGKLLSGKDTVADRMEFILNNEWNADYSKVRFADRLKRAVSGLTGCSLQDLESQDFKASLSPIHDRSAGFYTYRQLLQQMGDLLRELNPDILIDALFANLRTNRLYIIPDVRKENEIVAIKERGGIIIRIERPEYKSPDTHNTESELDGYAGFDYIIVNDGTLEDLTQKVRLLITSLTNDCLP